MLDAEFSPRLILKALHADFFFALFTVTKSTFLAAINSGIDSAEFSVFAVSDCAVNLLLDKRRSEVCFI
jgi:hypothetical protein